MKSGKGRIICFAPNVIGNISITDYAEVYITLDAGLLAAISSANDSKVTGETLVNTSSLAAGSYTVRLVSNRGNIFDCRTLVIR